MTVEEAVRVLIYDEHIEDEIYTVRDRAVQDSTFEGNSWDHPRVVRFSDACMTLKAAFPPSERKA